MNSSEHTTHAREEKRGSRIQCDCEWFIIFFIFIVRRSIRQKKTASYSIFLNSFDLMSREQANDESLIFHRYKLAEWFCSAILSPFHVLSSVVQASNERSEYVRS